MQQTSYFILFFRKQRQRKCSKQAISSYFSGSNVRGNAANKLFRPIFPKAASEEMQQTSYFVLFFWKQRQRKCNKQVISSYFSGSSVRENAANRLFRPISFQITHDYKLDK
jgi:hypothetical protein